MLPVIPAFIPNLMQVAPFVLAFALLCARPLRAYAGAFYAFWTLVVVAVSWCDPVVDIMQGATPAFVLHYSAALDSLSSTMPALKVAIDLLTSSYTGVFFYLIVMFIGVLPETPLVKKLFSIRSELSVLGGIIVMGHVVRIINFPFLFAIPYWAGMWGSPAMEFMFIAAVVIGPLLTLCFVVPWITSFKAIRSRMQHATWKKTQKLAYPFMALMLAQGFFLALGHCLYGYPFDGQDFYMAIASNPTAWLSTFAQQVATAWMYFTLGVTYLVLFIKKKRRRNHSSPTSNCEL